MNFKDIMLSEINQSQRHAVWFYSHEKWASLVAQIVKSPPTIWETWVQSLGWQDPLEKGMATHCSILAWRIPMDRILAGCSPWGCRVRHNWVTRHTHKSSPICRDWKEKDDCQGDGGGRNGKCYLVGIEFQFCRMSSVDCFHNSVKVHNATEPYIKKWLRW